MDSAEKAAGRSEKGNSVSDEKKKVYTLTVSLEYPRDSAKRLKIL